MKVGKEPSRRVPRSWIWMAALVLAFGLGLLAAHTPGLSSWLDSTLAALTHPRLVWAAARARQRLDHLVIDLDFAAYQQLFSSSPAGVNASGASTPSLCVPAQVSAGDGPLGVELCTPDGGPVPLEPGAAPFVLLAPQGDNVLGMDRALLSPALTAPALREDYLAYLADTGVIVPARRWVDLAVNGSDWGVYGVEALPEATMLADHGLSEGSVIVVFDDGALLDGRGAADGSFGYARPDVVTALGGASGGAVDDPALTVVADEALAVVRALERGAVAPSVHLDPDVWGAFLAADLLWCGLAMPPAYDQTATGDAQLTIARCAGLLPDWRSLRLAYDPQTGRLTPIATSSGWGGGYVPLPAAVVDDPLIAHAWVQRLLVLTAPDVLVGIRAHRAPAVRGLAATGGWGTTPDAAWDWLVERQARLRRLLTVERPLFAEIAVEGDGLLLYLDVTSPFPVEIVGLALGEGELLPFQETWLDERDLGLWVAGVERWVLRGRLGAAPVTTVVRVPLASLPDALTGVAGEVQVVTRIWGADAEIRVPATEGRPAAWGRSWER